MKKILIECISLSTPRGRILAFCAGLFFLGAIDFSAVTIPDLCIWKKLFGFCPAEGTTHALNAFLRGNFSQSINYNLNIIIIAPVLLIIIIKDALSILKLHK
ncbi:MAG: DUF2752 domain-containing protein [Candidatus Omnitrophica bacterium]|nr:DUF2752 domain-containing protein [Candidatus Omnitrophota bacterium]